MQQVIVRATDRMPQRRRHLPSPDWAVRIAVLVERAHPAAVEVNCEVAVRERVELDVVVAPPSHDDACLAVVKAVVVDLESRHLVIKVHPLHTRDPEEDRHARSDRRERVEPDHVPSMSPVSARVECPGVIYLKPTTCYKIVLEKQVVTTALNCRVRGVCDGVVVDPVTHTPPTDSWRVRARPTRKIAQKAPRNLILRPG
mmetsp:Transcript_13259/g.21257  ORF Transcript_13259/g.21257 Transcript_13259/m.21257 type:complete len:200 (-) Transcript_13259:323-922(-)